MCARLRAQSLEKEDEKKARQQGIVVMSPRLKSRLSGTCYHQQMNKPEEGCTH